MLYDDARTAPKTAEEHERDAYGSTYLTGEEARRILAAHKVAGRSKLGADEARRMAREQWPDEVRAAREAKVVRYRWLVAEVYAAGGDPGPLGRPRPPRARLWACIHPPPCRRDGHRGRGPGGT